MGHGLPTLRCLFSPMRRSLKETDQEEREKRTQSAPREKIGMIPTERKHTTGIKVYLSSVRLEPRSRCPLTINFPQLKPEWISLLIYCVCLYGRIFFSFLYFHFTFVNNDDEEVFFKLTLRK